jgi:hypothetical protein
MSNEAVTKAAGSQPAAPSATEERVVEFKVGDEEVRLTIAMVKGILTKPTKSGRLPADQDVVKFMMLLKAQRLNPWEDDCYLVGYDNHAGGSDWSMITSAGAYLKRADTHHAFDGMESGIIVRPIVGKGEPAGDIEYREGCLFLPDEDALMGGWARVWRTDRGRPTFKALTVASRKKPSPFWSLDNTHNQICKCAEVAAIRAAFPTIIGSMLSHEEHGRRMQTVDADIAETKTAPPAQIPEVATGKAKTRKALKPKQDQEPKPEPEPEAKAEAELPKPDQPRPEERKPVGSGDFARRAEMIEQIECVRKYKDLTFKKVLDEVGIDSEGWEESDTDVIAMIAAGLGLKAEAGKA